MTLNLASQTNGIRRMHWGNICLCSLIGPLSGVMFFALMKLLTSFQFPTNALLSGIIISYFSTFFGLYFGARKAPIDKLPELP